MSFRRCGSAAPGPLGVVPHDAAGSHVRSDCRRASWVHPRKEAIGGLMRAAVLQRPGLVTIEERADPERGPGEVLVGVAAVGICGSDVHYYRHGRIGRYVVEQPLVLGHESSGTIAALGAGVPQTRLGERVAVEPGVPCRRCAWCKRGRYNLCPFVVFLGT